MCTAGQRVLLTITGPEPSFISLLPSCHNAHAPMLLGKNKRLSLIFYSCWRNKVSNFCLGKFAKDGPFCELNGPDVNTKNSLDNSGSNENMPKVNLENLNSWVFHPT